MWREPVARGHEVLYPQMRVQPKNPRLVRYDRISRAICSSNWTYTRVGVHPCDTPFGRRANLCLGCLIDAGLSLPALSLLRLAADGLIQAIRRWRSSTVRLSLTVSRHAQWAT